MSEDQKLAAGVVSAVALLALYANDIRRVKKASKKLQQRTARIETMLNYDPLFQFVQ